MSKPRKTISKVEKSLILELYKVGKTDKEIADIIGLAKTTFVDMIKYLDLTDAIKKAKEIPNKVVEDSLYKNAVGRILTETKTETAVDTEGRIIGSKVIKTEREVKGDTLAQIYWTCNRMSGKWKSVNKIINTLESSETFTSNSTVYISVLMEKGEDGKTLQEKIIEGIYKRNPEAISK